MSFEFYENEAGYLAHNDVSQEALIRLQKRAERQGKKLQYLFASR